MTKIHFATGDVNAHQLHLYFSSKGADCVYLFPEIDKLLIAPFNNKEQLKVLDSIFEEIKLFSDDYKDIYILSFSEIIFSWLRLKIVKNELSSSDAYFHYLSDNGTESIFQVDEYGAYPNAPGDFFSTLYELLEQIVLTGISKRKKV